MMMMKSASLLAFMLACASDVKALESQDRQDPQLHATLTASTPRQELPISAFAAPASLTLSLTAIDNPSSQAFSVGVGVTWRSADGSSVNEDIGNITPYPASAPGSFLLSVPQAARELLARRQGRLSLRLSLLPIAADRPLVEPLKVTVGDLTWR